jgi:hypothetical protein
MNYFKQTNFLHPAWNITFDIPTPGPVLYEKHFTNVDEILPVDLLDRLSTINMIPEYVRLFVWPINHCGIWHIDGTPDLYRNSAMNWIIGGSGSIQFNSTVSLGLIRGVYRGRLSTLDEPFETETSGHGCLINTQSIHRVVTGPDGRNTLSIGWKNKDIMFEEMVQKLQQINMV